MSGARVSARRIGRGRLTRPALGLPACPPDVWGRGGRPPSGWRLPHGAAVEWWGPMVVPHPAKGDPGQPAGRTSGLAAPGGPDRTRRQSARAPRVVRGRPPAPASRSSLAVRSPPSPPPGARCRARPWSPARVAQHPRSPSRAGLWGGPGRAVEGPASGARDGGLAAGREAIGLGAPAPPRRRAGRGRYHHRSAVHEAVPRRGVNCRVGPDAPPRASPSSVPPWSGTS